MKPQFDKREALRKRLMRRAKEQIQETMSGPEVHIIKAVNVLTDLDTINNLMKENIEDWKKRSPQGKATEALGDLQKNSVLIEEERKKLFTFIETEMSKALPKFTHMATPLIGAKLLASAGSVRELAFAPSSTIQVLGADKALFAHMRNNGSSPKHGHIFGHPTIQRAQRRDRGKIARQLANKLAMEIKKDYFSRK